jgi:hypothetical protein
MAPLLTVLIPAYNEQATLGELLRRVFAAPYEKQVIVVDDASTDATGDILAAWEGRCQVVRHPTNRGKGAAIRTGLAEAVGRFTIVQDADLEYDPQDYRLLVEPLLAGEADVVYGSRYLRVGSAVRTNAERQTAELSRGIAEELVRTADPTNRGARLPGKPAWTNRLGVMGLNLAVRAWYGARLTDEATCYKAFPTEVLRAMNLECERFEFCPEVTAKALRMGLTILETPISYSARTAAEGKKIRLRDGIEALQTLWRWRRWTPSSQPPSPHWSAARQAQMSTASSRHE